MRKSARSFPLAVRVQGQDLCFVGTDLPVGWFFAGAPDDMPGSACWQGATRKKRDDIGRQHAAWKAAVLTRAVYVQREPAESASVWTPLTPELVQRLGGTERDDAPAGELACAYFSALGWITPSDTGYRECDLPYPDGVVLAEQEMTAERRRAMVHLPGHNTLSGVKYIADQCHTSVQRVWRSWWASDFVYEYRARMTPTVTAKQSAATGLTAEMASIGVGN